MRITDAILRTCGAGNCPITVKVPLVVVLFMFVVSAVLTERVLSRLQATQEAHLHQLTSTYMDGLSATVIPHVLRHDVWEVFDALASASLGYKALMLISTTVTGPDDVVIASSNPRGVPSDSRLNSSILSRFAEGQVFVVDYRTGKAHTRRLLRDQDRQLGTIYAEIGIAQLLTERRDVLLTLIITNTLLMLALAGMAYFAVRGMVGPIKVLSDHLGRAQAGPVEPIPASLMVSPDSGFAALFAHYNEMASAVNEREALARRLAEEEKLASLGRLASGMAHDINNPLGGLFSALDALKHHGSKAVVRATSISLLERGLAGIRDVVRALLLVYRTDQMQRNLVSTDLEDLRILLQPELGRRHLQLVWHVALTEDVALPAAAVRDAVLNLLLNACAATPPGGMVSFRAHVANGTLELTFEDGGAGVPAKAKAYLERDGGGIAPIEDRAGLGLWMVRRLADEAGGSIAIAQGQPTGSIITLRLPLSGREVLQDVA